MKKILFPLMLISTAFNSFGMEDDDSSGIVAIEMSEVTPGGIEEATHSPEETTRKSFCSKPKAAVSCCGIFSLCLYAASSITSAFSNGPSFEESAPELSMCPFRTQEELQRHDESLRAFREKYPEWTYDVYDCRYYQPEPAPEPIRQTNDRKRGMLAHNSNRAYEKSSACYYPAYKSYGESWWIYWYRGEHETVPCGVNCDEVGVGNVDVRGHYYHRLLNGTTVKEGIAHEHFKMGRHPKPKVHGRGGKSTHRIKN